MKKAVTVLILFISFIGFSQQDSKIKISGNGNQITNLQEGNDTSQKSGIEVKGDTNKVHSTQEGLTISPKPPEEKGIMDHIKNTQVIVALIVSGVALWGIIKGIPFIKKLLERR